jgi:hypothetical protein
MIKKRKNNKKMYFQLKEDLDLNSPTYILTSDFQYPLPSYGEYDESVKTFRVSNNHQYLSMICIHSDSKPYKVQLTLNDMVFAECGENSIILANSPEEVFSEFVNDSRFHPNEFPKRHEPMEKIATKFCYIEIHLIYTIDQRMFLQLVIFSP